MNSASMGYASGYLPRIYIRSIRVAKYTESTAMDIGLLDVNF